MIQFPPEPIDLHTVFASDGGQGLQRLDDAFDEYLTIPTTLAEDDRRYTRAELDSLDNKAIRALLVDRGLSGDFGDQHEHLVRLALNTQRIPVAFGGASIRFSDPRFFTGRPGSSGDRDVAVPYPLVVLTRTRIAPELTRNHSAALRKIAWTSDGNQVLMSPQPIPLTVSYQIELLSLSQVQINQMDAFLLRGFGIRDSIIHVDLGTPWGEQLVFINFDAGYSDDSQLSSPLASAKRIFRHTYSAELDYWLPQPSKLVRTVRDVRTIVATKKPDGTIDELGQVPTVEWEDYDPEESYTDPLVIGTEE